MNKFVKLFKKKAKQTFEIALTAYYSIILVLKIIYRTPNLSQIYIFHLGGFGNTLMQTDLYLRYICKSGFVVMLYSKNRHNVIIQNLYENKFILVRRPLSWCNLDYERPNIELRVIKIVKKILFVGISRRNIWQLSDLKPIARIHGINTNEVLAHWRQKLWYMSVSGKKFERSINNKFFELEINLMRKKISGRVCSIYLRNKGSLSDFKSHARNGKSLTEYIPLIEELIRLNFTIFLYGDITTSEITSLSGFQKVFTYKNMKLNKSIWDIFAPFYSEFTIGSSGGGLQIPISLGKKILLLDGFGYWNWFPNTLHSFKLILGKNGTILNPLKYLHDDLNFDLVRSLVVKNSPSELDLRVLHEFIEYLRNWPTVDSYTRKIQVESLVHFAPGAIISREWMNWCVK